MTKKILFIGLMLVLAGCSERTIKYVKTKDFEIRDNYYINYKYGFELTIPNDWTFGMEQRKYSGYILLVTFNKKINRTFQKVGALSFYYLDQQGNEEEKYLFLKEIESLEKDIELGNKEVEKYISESRTGKLKILVSLDKVSLMKTKNSNRDYSWGYIENKYKTILFKKGNIISEKWVKSYLYSYYIPFKARNSMLYYLPLEIGFNEYEKYNFTEEEKENYLREQLQILQSFNVFSNFVRDGLPSAKE